MSGTWKNGSSLSLVIAVVALALVLTGRSVPARAEREAAAGALPRYSVVESEAHNLVVTDYQTGTLYFYAIDKDKEVGSELKLLGTNDLKQVGKPTIRPAKGGRVIPQRRGA